MAVLNLAVQWGVVNTHQSPAFTPFGAVPGAGATGPSVSSMPHFKKIFNLYSFILATLGLGCCMWNLVP